MRRQGGAAGRKRVRLNRFWLCSLCLAALLVFALVKLEGRIRPVARRAAEYACQARAAQWTQQVVAGCLNEQAALFENLYTVRYDAAGGVQSASVDAAGLAALQYALESELTRSLEAGEMDFSIPLGTLSGLQIFSGRGPEIRVRVVPLAHVDSRVDSSFMAAGINQTQLRTDLVFTVHMCALLAGEQVEASAQSEICVAQLFVVGQTPQFFVEGADAAG